MSDSLPLPDPPKGLRALGKKVTKYSGLDTFDAPGSVNRIRLISDEVTALCPVTSQPDWYVVEVEYEPDQLCVESKSYKLLLHSFRDLGIFCEGLAEDILLEVVKHAEPKTCIVTVTQKPRGGVSVEAEARYPSDY